MEIKEFKNLNLCVARINLSPDAFWCFLWYYVRDIQRFLCKNGVDARPPIDSIKGVYTHNISEYVDVDFYTWVKYCDVESFPQDLVKLGRWLGISHSVGSVMMY